MTFGNGAQQQIPVNNSAKRAVLGHCNTTSNFPCTYDTIVVESNTTTTLATIETFDFISTPDNLYTQPYIYSLTFSSNPLLPVIDASGCTVYGYGNATIEFTYQSSTPIRFPVILNSYTSGTTSSGCATTFYSTFAPGSSSITTSQSNGSYYTINQGTYNVQVFFDGGPTTSEQSFTFGTPNLSSSPISQTITNNSN